MKFLSLFKNITIKQANLFTIIIVFLFSILFVSLLIEDRYEDYEAAQQKNLMYNNADISNEKLQKENQAELKSMLIKAILSIVTLSFIIFAIAFGFYKILNALIQRDIQTFKHFFQMAAHEEKNIDAKSIFFEDFKNMVVDVNEMVETISGQKALLRELNASLEDRVKEKTKNLQLINQNLEEEKVFSQELLQSQKEFLRYTVHETNTPLSVILTSIELYTIKHQKDRQLSKIESAVKNIFTIYDDLSYLVKKDQIEYPKSMINLEKYIGSRIDFFQEVAEHSLISFEYIPKMIDAHIYFNETKLQRVVDNTITNAIKYTLVKQKVDVEIQQQGSFVEFSMGSKSKSIQNTEKVFDAYYREDKFAKQNDGFGLGLRLVRTICEEEDVAVAVKSDEDYTVFTYKFKMIGV